MHPLSGNFSELKDSEIEDKVADLTKKYFMTSNTDIKTQITMLLESYKEELSNRRRASLEKLMKSSEKNLDKLIKVN
jgi:formate dehydrogenase maturation protein FdhE